MHNYGLHIFLWLFVACCTAVPANAHFPWLIGSEDANFDLPPLPFEITSFGAVRHRNQLYIYGGHTGDAHAYFSEAQSNKLLRLDLDQAGSSWQEIAVGERRQGLGMVAYENQLIILGGFSAKNKEGEKQDLHSFADVRAFDLTTQAWQDLPSLPEPRSSHDAALIGNTIYVVGGWQLAGEGKTTWHDTAWSMDLQSTNRKWVAIAAPPFQRRASATVAHQGKLFVIGGMNEQGRPTKAVSMYDPANNTWRSAADLLGEQPMAGFGAGAWSSDGQLVVTTYEGAIQRWDDATNGWHLLGKSRDARFFHRLLPLNDGKLLAIGGANMESGKFLDLEVIRVR